MEVQNIAIVKKEKQDIKAAGQFGYFCHCVRHRELLSASKEEIGNTSENWFHKLFSTHSHICGDCMVMMMKK